MCYRRTESNIDVKAVHIPVFLLGPEENHLVKSERELVAHKERSRLTPAKIVVLFVPSTECGTGVRCFVLVPFCQDKCPRQFTIFLRLQRQKFPNCYRRCRRRQQRRDALMSSVR